MRRPSEFRARQEDATERSVPQGVEGSESLDRRIESTVQLVRSSLVTLPDVLAVALCGSAARGQVDEWSDIDLLVLYARIPSVSLIERCVPRQCSGMRVAATDCEEEVFQSFSIDERRVDIRHKSIEAWRRKFDTVKSNTSQNFNLSDQKPFSDFQYAVALAGSAYLHKVKSDMQDYPEPLQRAMLDRYTCFEPLNKLEIFRQRGDYAALTVAVVDNVHCILGILFALNRVYHPSSLKHLAQICWRLPTRPDGLADRIHKLFTQPVCCHDELERLTRDTLQLLLANGHVAHALNGARRAWPT